MDQPDHTDENMDMNPYGKSTQDEIQTMNDVNRTTDNEMIPDNQMSTDNNQGGGLMFSAKNSQSIDQLIYEALRNDLEERRHVDMVFSYYNEATGKVEHSTRCHRVALAAKSCLLQQLLYHSGFEEDRTLVLVGNGEMSADDDLVRLLYDPDKCGKDITLWDEEAVKLRPRVLEEIEIKPDVVPDEDPDFNNYHIKKEMDEDYDEDGEMKEEEEDDDDAEYLGHEMDDEDEYYPPPLPRRRHERNGVKEEEPRIKKEKRSSVKDELGVDIDVQRSLPRDECPMSLEKIRVLASENDSVIGYIGYDQTRYGRYQAITYDGNLTPYSRCKNCKAVIHHKNLESHREECKVKAWSKRSKLLQHGNTQHFSSMIKSDSRGQEYRAQNKAMCNTLAQLFRTGSDRVERFRPADGDLPAGLSEKFDCVRYEGKMVPWAVCVKCSMLVLIDLRPHGVPWRALEVHRCNPGKGRSLMRFTAPITDDINIEMLQGLIAAGDPKVELKRIHNSFEYKQAMPIENLAGYYKHVFYNKALVPFFCCRMCVRVVEEARAGEHECYKANADLTEIYKNERSRITVLDGETVNMLYPNIVPVKLDGTLTDFVFCQKCDTFLARAVVQRSDWKGNEHDLTSI